MIESLLDYTLGRVGYLEVQPKLAAIAEALDPDNLTETALKQRLSDELFDLARRVLPIDAVSGEIADRAAGLLALVGALQKGFAELDGEFQGLVDHLLSGAGLAPGSELRDVLGRARDLGDLDAQQLLDRVLDGHAGELETAIELLGSKSLHELLVDGSQALHDEVGRLAGGAGKLLTLLETVDDAHLTDVLAKATGSGRTRRLVMLLQSAPSTPAELREYLAEKADAELRAAIEKVAGTAIDGIVKKKQVRRLLAWAAKAHDVLNDAATVDAQLRAKLGKIKDRIGFVATFSLDRVTRTTALVDVELDPKSGACRKAFRSLAEGDLVEFTEKLPFPPDRDVGSEAEPPDAEALSFHFHSFVLATDRSTQLTAIFAPSIGGGSKRTRKAFDSSRMEIAAGTTGRVGTYSGGLILSTGAGKEGFLRSWTGSVTLRSTARGSSPAIGRPYDEVSHELRLSTRRYDDDAIAHRLPSLDHMLRVFGFPSSQVSIRVPPQATATRITVDLALSGPGVERLLDPFAGATAGQLARDEDLDAEFLGAGADYLDEPLIELPWANSPAGKVMSEIVGSPTYRERWRQGDWIAPFTLTKGALSVVVAATADSHRQHPGSRFGPALQVLALARSWSTKPSARLGKAWGAVSGGQNVDHAGLTELVRAFRRFARVSTPGLFAWPSPLFQHFLTLRRAGTADLTVVATIAWRDGTGAWQPTLYLREPGAGA